uniref:GPALPP motifs-containing protein 1-like n=1 Tax=Crassostrea virginica TaxID=6565 RepID=A0A8B8E899_CRAVI|nr:GPALPP motifs-containing protein 1-like [Crassostrea virginica]
MSDDESFGPALPPGFGGGNKTQEKKSSLGNQTAGIGPQLPPHLQTSRDSSSDEDEKSCIGPSLPPHLRLSINQSTKSNDTENEFHCQSKSLDTHSSSVIGPVLPPHLSQKNYDNEFKEDVIGPCLPRNKSSKEDNVIGPSLPPHLQRNVNSSTSSKEEKHDDDDDNDDDLIGPLPSEMTAGNSGTNFSAEFERRAKKMKDHLDGKAESEGQIKRESWMTELPDCLGQNIGLAARTFRAHAGPDMSDRTMWTDSPADRARKEKEGEKESRKRAHPGPSDFGRDQQIRAEVESYNKSRRTDSLLNMHQKKMKKQQKEESDKPKERRPFDRDLDLQANRFDDAQRKAIIKKSQDLNSRFGHSKGGQYL